MDSVSVVVPVYNRSHIIGRTLSSIQEQSIKVKEVIIVDDCSSDSEALKGEIDKFKGLNIKYVRHKVNLHGGAARNSGIELCSGSYVAFLDSDDAWASNKIEICLKYIKNKKVDFVYSQVRKIGIQSGIVPLNFPSEGQRYSDYLLVDNGSIQTSTILIKREVLDIVKFDPNLKRFQDYDFLLALELNKNTSYPIKQPLVYMYDDDQEGRISNSYDYRPAVFWLSKIKNDISHEAYYNFLIGRVCQYKSYSSKKIEALKHMLHIKAYKNCNKRTWWKVFFMLILPNYIVNKIKKTLKG